MKPVFNATEGDIKSKEVLSSKIRFFFFSKQLISLLLISLDINWKH